MPLIPVRDGEPPGPALVVEGVSFSYGRLPVLEDVNLSVGRGELVALAGPNGSGKSTLVRILLGLARPASGSVRLLGEAPEHLSARWRVGYVPQRPALAEHISATVEEVVAAGCLARRGWARRLAPDDEARIDAALETVALTAQRRSLMAQLSGGQQQRAFIARALVCEPEILVLDEPIAGVDAESQARFRDALVERCRSAATAVLLVSHELGAVADDLDRILVLRRGRVVFDGPPEELIRGGVSLGVHPSDLPLWLEGLA